MCREHRRKKTLMFLVKMPLITSKIDNLIGWNVGNVTHVTLEQKSDLFQRHPHNTHNTTLAPASYCELGKCTFAMQFAYSMARQDSLPTRDQSKKKDYYKFTDSFVFRRLNNLKLTSTTTRIVYNYLN